jgi:hypothetical protein
MSPSTPAQTWSPDAKICENGFKFVFEGEYFPFGINRKELSYICTFTSNWPAGLQHGAFFEFRSVSFTVIAVWRIIVKLSIYVP